MKRYELGWAGQFDRPHEMLPADDGAYVKYVDAQAAIKTAIEEDRERVWREFYDAIRSNGQDMNRHVWHVMIAIKNALFPTATTQDINTIEPGGDKTND